MKLFFGTAHSTVKDERHACKERLCCAVMFCWCDPPSPPKETYRAGSSIRAMSFERTGAHVYLPTRDLLVQENHRKKTWRCARFLSGAVALVESACRYRGQTRTVPVTGVIFIVRKLSPDAFPWQRDRDGPGGTRCPVSRASLLPASSARGLMNAG